MRLKPLELGTLRAIGPRLCAKHRAEILRQFDSVEAWALNRAQLRGLHYAIEDDSGPMVVGGVIDQGEDGYIWFACVDGWERYLKTMLVFFREVRHSHAYRALHCECFADNAKARHLIERAGFAPHAAARDVLSYRMAL
jgi:hypothetical protein